MSSKFPTISTVAILGAWTFMLGLVLVLSLASAPAQAELPSSSSGSSSDPSADPFREHLIPLELVMSFRRDIEFTKQQNDKVGRWVVEVQKSVAEKQWQMQTAYFDLLEALDSADINEKKTLKLFETAIDLENDIKLEQIRLLLRLRNLLKPEQIAFLRQQIANGWTENDAP